MLQVIIISVLVVVISLIFKNPAVTKYSYSPRKEIHQYLCGFNMYLCLKNKLFLFPPKEISVNKRYYTLNLSTRNNLLRHKSINSNGLSESNSTCTECLHRCRLYSSDIVDLKMSFYSFRKLDNNELKKYLENILTAEQFEQLFSKEN